MEYPDLHEVSLQHNNKNNLQNLASLCPPHRLRRYLGLVHNTHLLLLSIKFSLTDQSIVYTYLLMIIYLVTYIPQKILQSCNGGSSAGKLNQKMAACMALLLLINNYRKQQTSCQSHPENINSDLS